MRINTSTKVFAGFSLAIVLILGVSILTYITVKNLLESVETLSSPNERLLSYNQLLADVYKLDQDDNEADSLSPADRVRERLTFLEQRSEDPIEVYKLNSIWFNIEELLDVQANLEEVKLRVANRDFSKEALDNIERKIRRQEERRSLENLERLRSRMDVPRELREPYSEQQERQAVTRDTTSVAENEIEDTEMDLVIDFLESNLGISDLQATKRSPSDSILLALREYMQELTGEERQLRTRMANLEGQLLRKNRDLILYIQDIIASLQQEAIKQGRAENAYAYNLTFRLSIFLAVLVLLGVVGSAAFIVTITREIRKSQEYNKTLREAKAKSERLAQAKQEFLANMSHEIRNPLHVIQGYQEALRKTDLNEKQQEFLNLSEVASETLLGVVNDILDFSKLEAGKINIEENPFDPERLFAQTVVLFENKAKEKNIDLELHTDFPSDRWLLGDRLRLSQILNNLLSNAIKFTDSGTVSLVAGYIKQEGLKIKVKDTGMGMSAEVRNRIFSAFDQGDTTITRKFGGTGLGLSIVKRLVVLMGGQINVESTVGEGTLFTITLPLQQTLPQVTDQKADTTDTGLDGIRILLVDDDQVVLKYTKMLLSSLGADVVSFNGGIAFRDGFESGNFDLAMVDIQMPEVSGYDVLDKLKSLPEFKAVPVLALTANVFAKEKNNIKSMGFDGIVLKPFKEAELLDQLTHHIDLKRSTKEVKMPNQTNIPHAIRQAGKTRYSLATIEKFAMGDEELIAELVGDFLKQTYIDLERMETALATKNLKELREIAHQLSSRLGQFGISAGKNAKEIEVELKSGVPSELNRRVEELVKEATSVLNDMAKDHDFNLSGTI